MGLDIGTLVGFVDLDASRFDQTLTRTQQRMTRFAGTRVRDVALGADASRVETATRQAAASIRALESNSPTVRIDSDASTVQADLSRIESQLRSIPPGDVQVDADVSTALGQLDRLQSQVRSLPDGTVEIDADTAAAISDLQRMTDAAASAGAQGGAEAGEGIVDGISSQTGVLASRSGPIVGSIIGAIGLVSSLAPGVLLMNAITKGMETQATRGLFSARTGLDAETAKRFGVSAGESYAANFGTSVTDNLDAARVALQSGLLGGDATQSEITSTINGLTTVSQILGAEVPEVARAAGQAVKTGLADSTTSALDLITRAYQGGLDVSGDLLDTITEYGTQFRKVGLDGPTALGLVSQAVRGGARDTDVAADAIKEFSIRAIDGSKTTVDAYKAIGLNAEEMQQKIASGGPAAQEGLEQVFTALRDIEDPAALSAAAVGLFGTQAEDLGAALGSFDLAAAREEFADTAGTLAEATAAIGANPAAAVETAKRSIEVSAQGIQEALAVAFGPQIQNFAEYISTHREEIISFMFDAASATLEFAGEMAGLASAGLRAGADLIETFSTVGTSIYSNLGDILGAADAAFGWIPGVGDRLAEAGDKFDLLAEGSEASSSAIVDGMRAAADGIDATLVPTLEGAQGKLDEFGIPAIAQAALADATTEASSSIADVGTAADGTQLQLDDLSGSLDLSTEAGSALDGQLRTAAEAMQNAATAGAAAGAGADELTSSANASREALVNQLTAMGFTREAAERLADSYAKVPKIVTTAIQANGLAAANDAAAAFQRRLDAINGRQVSATILAITAAGGNTGGGRAAGGRIPGAPSSTDNLLLPMATGEFVIRASQVQQNLPLLEAINAGTVRVGAGLAAGGLAGGAGATVSRSSIAAALTAAATITPVAGTRYATAEDQATRLTAGQVAAEQRLLDVRAQNVAALAALKDAAEAEEEAAQARADAEEEAAQRELERIKDLVAAEKQAFQDRQDQEKYEFEQRAERDEESAKRAATDALAALKARNKDKALDAEIAALERSQKDSSQSAEEKAEAAKRAFKLAQEAEARDLEARQKAFLTGLEDENTAAKKRNKAATDALVQANEDRIETEEDLAAKRAAAAEDELTESKERAAEATAELAAAEAELAQARADALALADRIAGSVTSAFDLDSLLGSGGVTSLLANADKQVARAKELADSVAALVGQGLNTDLIDQITAQGTSGLNVTRALLAGGEDAVDRLNASYAELTGVGQGLGTFVSAGRYSPGERVQAQDYGTLRLDEASVAAIAQAVVSRPVTLTADGRALAQVVSAAQSRNDYLTQGASQ